MNFKRLIYCVVLGIAGAAAHAQSFPVKPITLVVPYSPGGSTDIMARVMAQHLPAIVGQSVVVDNRTGGGGLVGWAAWPAPRPTATPCSPAKCRIRSRRRFCPACRLTPSLRFRT